MKKKIVISVAAVVVLVAAIALLIMYNLGDRLIEEVLKSELLLDEEFSVETENTGKELETNNDPEITDDINTKSENETNNIQDGASSHDTIEATPEAEDNSGQSSVAAGRPSDGSSTGQSVKPSVKPSAKPSTKPAKESDKANTNLTAEKINEIKKEVSASDKISAAAMVLKRLSTSDINELKSMISGGLDAAEMKRAKQIAYDRFSEDEIKIIKGMYEKYGDK